MRDPARPASPAGRGLMRRSSLRAVAFVITASLAAGCVSVAPSAVAAPSAPAAAGSTLASALAATPPAPARAGSSSRPTPEAGASVPAASPSAASRPVASSSTRPPRTEPSAASTPSALSSRLPSPTPAPTLPAPLAWTSVDPPRLASASPSCPTPDWTSVNDVVAAGSGFVAVGYDAPQGCQDDARVMVSWISADGLAWTEHVLDSVAAWAVAAGGGMVVAVGDGIWRSRDGVAWDPTVERSGSSPIWDDVAASPEGFVALGRSRSSGDPVVWTAGPDGTGWRAGDAAGLASFCPRMMTGGPGGYLVSGIEASSCGLSVGRPAGAWSADGRAWTRIPAQASMDGQGALDGAAPRGRGWIAYGRFLEPAHAGQSRYWGVAVWNSADGLRWTRTSFLRPVPPYVSSDDASNVQMMGIAPVGSGYLAVGQWAFNNDWSGTVWTSADGATWRSLQVAPQLLAIATDGRRLVALGTTGWIDYLPIFYVASLEEGAG